MSIFKALAKNARKFRMFTVMFLQKFGLALPKMEQIRPEAEMERFSQRLRQCAIGIGRRFTLDLRNRVLILLSTTGRMPPRMSSGGGRLTWYGFS